MSSNITELLAAILSAKYGEEVRGSIHDAIELCYADGKAGVNDLEARRLIEAVAAVNESQEADIEALTARVEELEQGEGGGGSEESTSIDIDTLIFDHGQVNQVQVNNNQQVTRHVTFAKPFTEVPTVALTWGKQTGGASAYARITACILYETLSKTGFDFFISNTSGAVRSPTVTWCAWQPTTKTIDLDITIPDAHGMSEAEVREITGPIAASVDAIKTGYDGTVYTTPGEAVRTQINDLHVLIGDTPGTAIQASAVAYGDSNVGAELTNVNGRLQLQDTNIGDLSQLQTEDKTNLVAAINEAAQTGGSGSGLTAEIKNALLQMASKVAYIDAHGQDYYNALYDSFYPSVASISAVYTQQGRVYSATDLNSLKSNLVVTANYKDGTNIRLSKSDYTLSGKLTTGTSIITVAYGDKTATFNVTVTGVVSIDAVYTQSGVVPDTDDLSVLIPDLVVTAALDDGTSFVVPSTDYTLSGTLSDRTSTITVAYGSLSDTFTVTVTEVINYTKNPLENVMWMQGYLYNKSTGVIGASANEWSSDKFTAQNCTYILTNADTTNNKYVLLLAWDENGNYIGFTHNGQGLYALKKNYTYAISLTNTTEFDQSTITLMPKDNTMTKAGTFSIRLSDFIGKITNYSPVYQINVSSIMNDAGVTSSNWNDKFASCNYLAALFMDPYPDPFLNRDLRFWFATDTIMRFDCDSVGGNNIAGLEAWITENDPVITFN